MSNNTKPALC